MHCGMSHCPYGASDFEPTESLSVDGNSSELDEDEDEVRVFQQVPPTPDQEAFLKENFVTLADLAASGKNQQPR